MKNDVNSISIAPVSIIPACLNMIGIARLPTVDAPVKNFAASIHPPPSRLIKNCVEPPPKNIQGIGTTTYMSAESIGHQLLYKAHARIWRRILDENMKASPASTVTQQNSRLSIPEETGEVRTGETKAVASPKPRLGLHVSSSEACFELGDRSILQ